MRRSSPRTSSAANARRRARRLRTLLIVVLGAVAGAAGIVIALKREPAPIPPAAAPRIDFSTRQSISLEEAGIAVIQPGPLNLDGLVTLAPETAAVLARHEGAVSLRGLVERLRSAEDVPAAVAAIVARTDVPLHFEGLAHLTVEVAEALAPHRRLLALPAVRTLSTPESEALVGHVGPLELPHLETLDSAALARKLLADETVDFSSVTSVSDAAAEVLAAAGRPLDLARLVAAAADCDDLDPSTARGIARHSGALRLTRLRTLSPTTAGLLALASGDVECPRLSALTPQAAEALVAHAGRLALPALRDPGAAADALSRHRGPLALERLQRLDSPALAAKLLADGQRDFSWVSDLSPDAAKCLAGCPESLRLDTLRQPSDDVVQILARHPGPLGLTGLVIESQFATRVTSTRADLLAKHSGRLSFPRLRDLGSVALAARLLDDGPEAFAAVETMSPDVEALVAGHDAPLPLDAVTAIRTAGLAAKLLRQGRTDFDRVTTITDEAAAVLAAHDGPLTVAALVDAVRRSPRLDEPLARLLARHAAEIGVESLVELSPGAADALAGHAGPLHLDRLTALPAPVAEALARHTGLLSLAGVKQFDGPAQESLARHSGPIRLGAIEELSSGPLAAKLLAGGRTEFGSVRVLSPAAATALAAMQGTLFLNAVETLDAATAAALAAHAGGLSLDGVTALDAAAAAALAAHAGDLSLNGLTALDPTTAAALARHAGPVYLDGLTSTGNGLRRTGFSLSPR